MATYEELMQSAEQIRTNELPESNTHELVGQHLKNQVEYSKNENNGLKTLIDNNKKEVDGKLAELGEKIPNTNFITCSTLNSVANKTVNILDFKLSNRVRLLVKMVNANAADNANLSISSPQLDTKPLYYNGERASATNTWEAGAVLDIYYDGANFQATDFAGGAGNGSGGNMILDWNTDVATTRKQVKQADRKEGMQISYKDPDNGWINEQYIGTAVTDTEWIKDANWSVIVDGKTLSLFGDVVGYNPLEKMDITITDGYYMPITLGAVANSSYEYATVDVSKYVGSNIIISAYCSLAAHIIFANSSNEYINYFQAQGEVEKTIPDGADKLYISNEKSKGSISVLIDGFGYTGGGLLERVKKLEESGGQDLQSEVDSIKTSVFGGNVTIKESSIQDGKWVSVTGSLNADTKYEVYEFNLENITANKINVTAKADAPTCLLFKNVDGTVLSYKQNYSGTTELSIPEESKTLLVSNLKGESTVEVYYVVTESIQSRVEYLEEESVRDIQMRLNGCKWKASGDSLTAGTSGGTSYFDFVKENLSCDGENVGIGGQAMVGIQIQMKGVTDANFASILGGTNDYGAGDGTPIESFKNTYRAIIDTYVSENPGKGLYLITPPPRFDKTGANTSGHTLEDYVNAILTVATEKKVPCLDLYRLAGFTEENKDIYLIADKLHMTEAGARRVAYLISRFISNCEMARRAATFNL